MWVSYPAGRVRGMAVAVFVSLDECGAMLAALVARFRTTRSTRAAGALAALSWLLGLTDRRPVSGDTEPATAKSVGPEVVLADRIARGAIDSWIPEAYAAGAVDAALWAMGRPTRQPLA